jgi:hypothetical protein
MALTDNAMLLGVEYFHPLREAAFSSADELTRVAKQIGIANASEDRPWLEGQDAYILHWSVRKRYPRNPYTGSHILDVWEFDLVDVQSLAKQ